MGKNFEVRLMELLADYSENERKKFLYQVKINDEFDTNYWWYHYDEFLDKFPLLDNKLLQYYTNTTRVYLNKIAKLDNMGVSYIVWDREKDLKMQLPMPNLETGMFVELTRLKPSKYATYDYLIGVVVNNKIIYQDGGYDMLDVFNTECAEDEDEELYYLNIFTAEEGLCFDIIRERHEGRNNRKPIWEGKVYWY